MAYTIQQLAFVTLKISIIKYVAKLGEAITSQAYIPTI